MVEVAGGRVAGHEEMIVYDWIRTETLDLDHEVRNQIQAKTSLRLCAMGFGRELVQARNNSDTRSTQRAQRSGGHRQSEIHFSATFSTFS